MKSKGFSINKDGREKKFPHGTDVSEEMVEEFDLVTKDLVDSDPEATGGPASGSTKSKTAKK